MDSQTSQQTADEIITLYELYGHEDYIGEPVSQLEHMSQCAQLAADAGHDEAVILAALFHDLGHLLEHIMPAEQMDGYGVVDHEKLGATYLQQKGFSTKLVKLVAAHVSAKRYLTFKHPGYYQQLSEASKRTLEFQGGVMNEQEAAEFEADPLHELYIQFRKWDEAAKLEQVALPSLDIYKEMIVRHLETQTGEP